MYTWPENTISKYIELASMSKIVKEHHDSWDSLGDTWILSLPGVELIIWDESSIVCLQGKRGRVLTDGSFPFKLLCIGEVNMGLLQIQK